MALNCLQELWTRANLSDALADPQTWKEWTRVRNANEYLSATEQLCASMGSFDFPFICFHGEVDTMTDPEGSKKLFAESKVSRNCSEIRL